MAKKKYNKYKTKAVEKTILQKCWSYFRFFLSLPDVILFGWYSALPKAVKQTQLVNTPQNRNMSAAARAKKLNVNSVYKHLITNVNKHTEETPFWICFVPTLILIVLIWI